MSPTLHSRGGKLLPALLAVAAACAANHAAVEPAPAEAATGYFNLRTPSTLLEVRVTPEALTGPTVQVQRTEDGLRGFAFNQTVDLRMEKNKVVGFIGSQPVELFLTTEGDKLILRGLYAGTLGRLEIGPAGVDGTVGACGYSLRQDAVAGATYDGQRTCRSQLEPVTLALPPGLEKQPSTDVAAVLALLLGG